MELTEAREEMSTMSPEKFTEIFPDWKSIQVSHLLTGKSVEESWDEFVKMYAERVEAKDE